MPDQQGHPPPRPVGKPLWRRAYDAVEKQAAPPLEGAVRTATFADAASLAVKLQARVRRTVTNRTAQLLHLVNLPAASDITRLREQVVQLDHELRQLRHGVEDAALASTASSPRATRVTNRPRTDNPKPNRRTEKLRSVDAPKSANSADTAASAASAASSANSNNSGRGDRDARAAQPRSTRSR